MSQTALDFARSYFGTQHPLFKAMNIDIISIEKGRAEMTMPCVPRMQDSRGALHRGAMVALFDNTSGIAIFSALGTVQPIATIDLRIDYFRDAAPGQGVRVMVECISKTDTVAYISGRALTLEDGVSLASVTGTFAINTMGPSMEGMLPGVRA